MAKRTKIIGVDYSGSASDVPWITTAVLEGQNLKLESPKPISRKKLTERLLALCRDPDNADAVVAMDFPFGVPRDFAEEEFKFKGSLMHEMWETIANLNDLPSYIKKIRPRICDKTGNLRKFNKLLRVWDQRHFPKIAKSPLNPAGPQMFPMTFHGMKMLHTLWEGKHCRVPPLDNDGRTGPVFLETMPGAALDARGLLRDYKKNKGVNTLNHLDNRKIIINKLPDTFGIDLPNFQDYRDICIFNDDALDSIVAAVVAAMWARDEEKILFHRPEDHHDDPAVLEAARREGCIYAPKK